GDVGGPIPCSTASPSASASRSRPSPRRPMTATPPPAAPGGSTAAPTHSPPRPDRKSSATPARGSPNSSPCLSTRPGGCAPRPPPPGKADQPAGPPAAPRPVTDRGPSGTLWLLRHTLVPVFAYPGGMACLPAGLVGRLPYDLGGVLVVPQ